MRKGNPQAEDGHIDIANETAEALARIQLSGYESRYLWVLWRKTYGWHKKEDVISNSQFVEATGLKKGHISKVQKRLIQRKIVTKNGNKLHFNKHYNEWQELPKMVTVTKNGNREIVTNSGIKVTKNGNHKDSSSTKETLQKKKSCEVTKNGNLTILHIFNFWKSQMNHPKAKLTNDRKTKIRVRLKDYSPHDCLLAILGCRYTRWNMGENPAHKRYDQIELIFRNGEKLETFRDTGEAVRKEQKQRRPLRPAEAKRQKEREEASKAVDWQKQLKKWKAMNLGELKREKEKYIFRAEGKKPIDGTPEELLWIIQEKEFRGGK